VRNIIEFMTVVFCSRAHHSGGGKSEGVDSNQGLGRVPNVTFHIRILREGKEGPALWRGYEYFMKESSNRTPFEVFGAGILILEGLCIRIGGEEIFLNFGKKALNEEGELISTKTNRGREWGLTGRSAGSLHQSCMIRWEGT